MRRLGCATGSVLTALTLTCAGLLVASPAASATGFPLLREHQPLFRLQEWSHRSAFTVESTHALPRDRKSWVASSTAWMDSSLRESVRLLKPSRKHSSHDIPGA